MMKEPAPEFGFACPCGLRDGRFPKPTILLVFEREVIGCRSCAKINNLDFGLVTQHLVSATLDLLHFDCRFLKSSIERGFEVRRCRRQRLADIPAIAIAIEQRARCSQTYQ
jgi:hypothetical protein